MMNDPRTMSKENTRVVAYPVFILASVFVLHVFASPSGEPWKFNDETRHVMTGVFVRDAIHDLPQFLANPKGYAVRYYTQYPALGLLVWPPFFHCVEGVTMAVFGTSYVVARVVLSAFAVLAAVYAYRLALRFHGVNVASISLALFGFAPLVVDFSRHVLLEVPTLALVLGSVFHFERYTADRRTRDALLACLLAACAALTRFDGVVLLPYFLLRLVMTRNFGLLLQKPVLVGVLAAITVTLPYYLFTWREYGKGLQTAAASGTAAYSTGFLDPWNFWLYPSFVVEQIGYVAALPAALGLFVCRRQVGGGNGPFFAMIVATYITFAPLAEPEKRHAIYWVPALTVFAAIGLSRLWQWSGRYAGVAAILFVVAATIVQATWKPGWYVIGYAEAAKYTLEHRTGDRPLLFEGVLNGNFIYQVRRADRDRRAWVLRGDKIFYAVMSDSHGGYVEFAVTDDEILAKLHDYDPEYIVIESRQIFYLETPASGRVRNVLKNHPELFRLEKTVTFDTNHEEFALGTLLIYRKLTTNPHRKTAIEIPVLGLGRSLGGSP